ncbi:hypothetical_protein [Leishmania braziliensis MHOM/BR/75/M2904]|uniref:Hypothetical_protein n=1 Tax=Leishmania braziliensis MHOM/BR/75/M2904 TaxID=420245 RepID=A0A3P3ZBS4_LEIBR|nr:unnamed protein product [Leishmania braziliensis]CAJ2476542.1 unnamed protein product [Leishmania braziliensis]CAJ2476984.1 unnamed protein product [Leishmania braziliensis]SYZ67663.1 hypothetical_protein [Leishmania braziliensis MHOM/BR/75/M2904]
MTSTLLPRLDVYTVPNLNRSQGWGCIQHRLDAIGMEAFLGAVDADSTGLDGLLAAGHQRRVSPTTYGNRRLPSAVRELQAAWGGDRSV